MIPQMKKKIILIKEPIKQNKPQKNSILMKMTQLNCKESTNKYISRSINQVGVSSQMNQIFPMHLGFKRSFMIKFTRASL
jgi:hypothetical protein